MKDPLYNPTPWLIYSRIKPITDKYYLSNKRVERKMLTDFEKLKHLLS